MRVNPDRPPLDRWRVDAVLEPDRGIWGLKSIASCLRVSEKTVRRWADDKSSGLPVSKPMGRWYAQRDELRAWLSSRQ